MASRKRSRTRTVRVPPPAAPPAPAPKGGRVTYRELRNTPGQVWERLAANEPLTLVADGETKAIVIPVTDGDADGALEAYQRGRAIMALNEIQEESRRTGRDKMTLAEINRIIREVRKEQREREARR